MRLLDKYLAHDCRIGKKRLLKSIARTRADDALTLTAAMISPVDPATGTASDRILPWQQARSADDRNMRLRGQSMSRSSRTSSSILF
jgi:hypothetical protein